MRQAGTIERTEQYFSILAGPVTNPVARVKYLDDAGVLQTIDDDVITLSVSIKRDDERETGSLLMPPASTLQISLANESKQFVNGFGGPYDGVITRGRRFFPELGHYIDGTPEYFNQGAYILDDPSFNVAPSATVRVTARDYFGVLVDSNVSLASEASIEASAYIKKILERVGIKPTEYNIPLTTTTLINTPTVDDENAAELLSEVMEYLQLEDSYRLVAKDKKITMEVPSTDVLAADYVFHWVRHISGGYSRKDDTLKLLRRLTMVKAAPTTQVALGQGTQSGKTEADLPFTHNLTNGPAIHVNWLQGSADTLELIETDRTLTTVVLDRKNPVATGSWSLEVWGDKVTAGTVGEAANGTNINLQRGKTNDIENRFIQNATEARGMADALGATLFSERVRADFSVGHGWMPGELNDLVRVVEKYSNDKRLYHLVGLQHRYSSRPAMLTSRLTAEYAGLSEAAQAYDIGFDYDEGRIYDERYTVGDESEEETEFTGTKVEAGAPDP